MQPKKPDFEDVIRAIHECGARTVLIGGFAMIAHGSNTDTRDIDFAFARDRENVRSIVKALSPFEPRPRDFPDDVPFVWDEEMVWNSTLLTLQTSAGKVDLLGETAGVESFEDLYDHAKTINLYGYPFKVASLEHLLAMKNAAGREKDLDHAALLREIQANEQIG